MKTVKDKQILVGADIAGVPLKNAVVEHLKAKGWTVTDIGVKTEDEENPEMFHRKMCIRDRAYSVLAENCDAAYSLYLPFF